MKTKSQGNIFVTHQWGGGSCLNALVWEGNLPQMLYVATKSCCSSLHLVDTLECWMSCCRREMRSLEPQVRSCGLLLSLARGPCVDSHQIRASPSNFLYGYMLNFNKNRGPHQKAISKKTQKLTPSIKPALISRCDWGCDSRGWSLDP